MAAAARIDDISLEESRCRWARAGRQLGTDRYLETRYGISRRIPRSLRLICTFLAEAFNEATLESAQPYLQSSGTGQARLASEFRKMAKLLFAAPPAAA
jgi:hypothetical protein